MDPRTPSYAIVDLRVVALEPDDYRVTLTLSTGRTIAFTGRDVYEFDRPFVDGADLLIFLMEGSVPTELIFRELAAVLPGWDPRAEIIRRSEADMAYWREKDQKRREALKREFRNRRKDLD